MPGTSAAVAALAGQLVETLQARRAAGDYPLTVDYLVEWIAPPADPALVAKARAHKAFLDRVVVVEKKHPATPVALREDRDLLAASPLALAHVLGACCTPEKPAVPLAQLARKVDASLRPAFLEAVQRQADAGTLPATVGTLTVRNKVSLFLTRMPPPPPPKKPEAALSERLVEVLRQQRSRGGAAYPVRLQQLIRLADPLAAPAVVKKALAQAPFRLDVLALLKGDADSPVALRDDLTGLLTGGTVLELLLRGARSEASSAFLAAELAKRLTPGVQAAFNEYLRAAPVPLTVGTVRIKSKTYYFLRDDAPPAPSGEPAVGLDFATAFDAAFTRLDRQTGSHNFVNLAALREALPYDKETFERGLRQLRVEGRYTLSAAEGRHAVGDGDRAAGILEGGALLLYVARKTG